MMLNEIICCIGAVLIAVGIAAAIVLKEKKKLAAIPVAAGLIIFVLGDSFEIIPTGYTGVKVTFGQISEDTLPTGLNWKIPFVQTIEKVNNKQQDVTAQGEIWAETTNRTAVCYNNITVTYKISEESSAWIYANVSNPDNLVTAEVISSAVKASSKTLEDEDATNRNIIEPLVQEQLQASFDQKYGENVIIVKKVVIQDADFEESYQESIAAKQQAQLEAEEQAIINEKNIAMAEAEYEVAIINAQAEADANEIIEASLSSKILQQMYIEAWDGQMPDVVMGEDASGIMISLDSLTDEDEPAEAEDDDDTNDAEAETTVQDTEETVAAAAESTEGENEE